MLLLSGSVHSVEPPKEHKEHKKTPSNSLIQHEGIWPTFNKQGNLNDKWAYLLHHQARFLNESHAVKTVLLEDSIGYSLNKDQRVWFGYFFSGNNFGNHSFNEQRIWEQFYWKVKTNDSHYGFRTRLEQIEFSNRAQNLIMFRQMFAKEFLTRYQGTINPLIFDEVFVRLNHPDYATQRAFSQNRVFLGFNVYANKNSTWRIGYLNQYETKTPHTQPVMNHILVIAYTFGDASISLPIDS